MKLKNTLLSRDTFYKYGKRKQEINLLLSTKDFISPW